MSKNQAQQIRPGEELNEASLRRYLDAHLGKTETLEIQQYPAGFSNLTYLIRHNRKEYVLRRPPHGAKIKSGHDMGREFKVLSALAPHYHKVPKAVLYESEAEPLGAPFYMMEKIEGTILRSTTPSSHWPDPASMLEIADELVLTLAELHQLDYVEAGLGDFGQPIGYTDRQVTGWYKRYQKSSTSTVAEMDKTAHWLQKHLPKDAEKASLIHNDFKYDNVVLEESTNKIIAILDWEMCTIGHPLMDLGTSLGYWVNSDDPDWLQRLALSPTTIPGNPSRAEVAEAYARHMNIPLGPISYYYVFGLFKIAVIVQQIYYRYVKGYTQDVRFKHLDQAVKGLAIQALQVIAKNRLDDLYSA
ncbi:MAG: phosphotransferase family protein [Saprospiraceae bacterium]|nr:phosphotransferase family protein [Saprospiraceae bacterium]